MEATQGKYDFLITALLPLHKKLLESENNPNILNEYIKELKENIGQYHDYEKELTGLLNTLYLAENSTLDNIEKNYIVLNCRNEALSILTKFFLELNPDD